MRTINVEFESLETLGAANLFGAFGVYVLWDQRAEHSPTYLGEGVILSRLSEHVKWLSSEVTGLVAILETKHDAEVAEALLLATAEDINRWPTRNSAPGKERRVHSLLETHGTVRLNVRGRHPFIHPDSKYSALNERAEISARATQDGFDLYVPWNKRR
jgi:hypothetical protein